MRSTINRLFISRLAPAALATILALPLVGCQTDKGATWPSFGKYRLPYADGTQVYVSNDFITHNPDGRYDLRGQGGGPYSVVAAADGWIRYIVDHNTGHQTGDNNFVWIEHPVPYCQPQGVTWPGKPANYDQTCVQCLGNRCNEWTKYSHMSANSTTEIADLAEGEWVTAGTFLGYEDDIGHAHNDHVHFEVTKVDPDEPFGAEPEDIANGMAWDWSGGDWLGSPNVLPQICDIGILYDGDTHVAAPCSAASMAPPVALALLWQSGAQQPMTATATIVLDGPDGAGRVTLKSVQLTSPVVFNHGASQVTVSSLRLVRPVTISLNRDGVGRAPADQLIWSATLILVAPEGGRTRNRLNGPVRGTLQIAVTPSHVQLSLDAGALGHISGAGLRQ
jgi:hypothetical protein